MGFLDVLSLLADLRVKKLKKPMLAVVEVGPCGNVWSREGLGLALNCVQSQ